MFETQCKFEVKIEYDGTFSHESSPIHGNSQVKLSIFHIPFWIKILSNFGYPKHLQGPLHNRPC
jgi:hypothetical protein